MAFGMAVSAPPFARRRLRFRWSGTVSRYLLGLTARRFAFISLGLTGVLLLERLLRLLDFVVAYHTSPATLAKMLLALTPHYLSLSIPAAALIAMMLTILSLRDSGELHAIDSWGVAIGEMTWLFTCVMGALSIVLVLMTGILNPYARYAFREATHEAKFVSAADIVATRPTFWRADQYDIYIPSWTPGEPVMLRPVLTRRTGSAYDAIEARTGRVIEAAEKQTVTIILKDGRVLRHAPTKGVPAVVRFNTLTIPVIHEEGGAFRPRGADERELTIGELLERTAGGQGAEARFTVELHMRFIRAFSILVFPLLAFAACVGPPRRTPMYGPALAAAGVLTYHFMLFALESLAVEAGGLATPVLWAPFLLMALVLFFVFRSKAGRFRAARGDATERLSAPLAAAAAGSEQ